MPLTPEEQTELNALEAEIGSLSMQDYTEMKTLERELDPQGFIGRVGQDIEQRSFDAREIQQAYDRGDIGKGEEIFQLAGKAGVGIVGDIAGEAIQSGIGALSAADEALGGYGRAGISRMGSAIGSLPSMGGGTIGQTIPQEIGRLAEGYQQFSEEHPRASTNIEAAANLAMLAPAVKYGEDIIDAGRNLKKIAKKSELQALGSEEIRAKAGDLFKLAEERGGAVKAAFWDSYVKDLEKIRPQTELGAVLEGESAVGKAVNALKSVKSKTNTLESIKEADSILGNMAEASVNNFGKYTAEGRDFLRMQMSLRDKINNAPASFFEGGKEGFEAVKEARKYWAASIRMDEVERIIAKAAGAEQPATIIKNGFRRLRDNPKKMKGYSAEEQFAIKKAAKSGAVGSFLKLSGSGLVPIMAGAGGAAATGGPGVVAAIPAYALQQASRAGAGALQARRGEQIRGAIRAGLGGVPDRNVMGAVGELAIPVGQAVGLAGTAAAATEVTPSTQGLAERAKRLFEEKKKRRK